MNNICVKKNNFRKFRKASKCCCINCRFNNVYKSSINFKDYISETELVDDDGWI